MNIILRNFKFALAALLFLLGTTSCVYADTKPGLTDDEIRQILIQQSIASYPGHCPCPYNVASNGSSCGKRSAYSRPGGFSPLCYNGDITPDMIAQYRKNPRSASAGEQAPQQSTEKLTEEEETSLYRQELSEDEIILLCVGKVRDETDRSLGKKVSDFDAYKGSDTLVRYAGTQMERFHFEKCMDKYGHPLDELHKESVH